MDGSGLDSTAEWTANCAFALDALRGARLDQAVRVGLAESLQTVFDSLDRLIAADRRCARLLHAIEAGPVPPGLFGVYVDLVLAIFAEREADARGLVDELLRPWPERPKGLRIVTLDDRELGPGQSARYRRLLSGDIACEIEPLTPKVRATATERLNQALDLLQIGAPDLYGELVALVREIVLVAPGDGPEGFIFGGASTFSLWGALVLNAEAFGERLDIAVSLAHEVAHTHLFGLALGGRLTENDEAERYPSPLRRDPRPMEGVAHATYVTARMAYALRALLACGRLDARETRSARDQLARNEAAYAQGLATVTAHARLTPVGAAAFDGLRRFMAGRG